MTGTSAQAAESISTEQDAIVAIQALAGKFGLKAHVWGTQDIENLIEEAGIDAGVDTEVLTEHEKRQIISEFKESQAWNETGLDIDIAMQDELGEILGKR